MNRLAILLAIFIPWAAYSGGVGCSSDPTVTVPLHCGGHGYHWGNVAGVAFEYTESGVLDMEWNGVNDGIGCAGIEDTDESDPQDDPRFFWDYAITSDGKWRTENYVWHDSADAEVQAWTWTPQLFFDVTANTTYHISIAHSADSAACPSGVQVMFAIHCAGHDDIWYHSWIDSTLPSWTAPETQTCTLEPWTTAIRGDVDPAIPLDECGAEDVFRVYR